MPIRVVRVEASWEIVHDRLSQDPTIARQVDLAEARAQIEERVREAISEVTSIPC
jgi:hypothetical protein